MNKLFLVVLYKCSISDSNTIKSFDRLGLFNVSKNFFVVWDNSPLRQEDAEIKHYVNKSNNCIYEHTPENRSLAVIYNTVIKSNPGIDYFIIFDQDSLLLDTNYEAI